MNEASPHKEGVLWAERAPLSLDVGLPGTASCSTGGSPRPGLAAALSSRH